MSKALTVQDNNVVMIHYTLTDSDGDVIDSSEGQEPMAYLHGANNIVPGLERQLEGKAAGDQVTAVVPPAEGYGGPLCGPPGPGEGGPAAAGLLALPCLGLRLGALHGVPRRR